MCSILTLSFLIKLLNLLGLCFDGYGVYKLFFLTPKHLTPIDKIELRAIFPPPDKNEFLIKKLDEMIIEINKQNKVIEKKAKDAFNFVIVGFALQVLAILLSIIY
ncbi:hypothetical protein LBMAG27_25270 [Bacteroidota bacterium]|nr:hypothetical protein LBMAG27_25270 [Bacteroidota bacterium]